MILLKESQRVSLINRFHSIKILTSKRFSHSKNRFDFVRARCLFVLQKDLALRGLSKIRNSFFLMDNLKNKGGRPRLTAGKRSVKIVSRFTDEEYKQILALEQELGINRSQIIRTRVLHNAEMIVVNSKELIGHLDSIGAEMGRAGNNINQLARHANVIKLKGDLPPAIAEKFNSLLESYVGMQGVLEMSLRKIIRMMAK